MINTTHTYCAQRGNRALCWSNVIKATSNQNEYFIKGQTCRFPGSVCPVQGDGARTSITLDFGDGHALTYSNVSSLEDGIKHIYKAVGIYRVTATGENSLGSETAMLYLHVTCEIPSFVKDVFVHLFRFSSVSALRFHFLSESMELLFPACTTSYTLSRHRACSPPLAKQTSEIEQIPFLFHSVQLMLCSHSARRSHGILIRNRADHPRVFRG